MAINAYIRVHAYIWVHEVSVNPRIPKANPTIDPITVKMHYNEIL